MWNNKDIDKHYIGLFNIFDEQFSGEIIYNQNNGNILLNIIKEVDSNNIFGKSYGSIPIINGKLNSGMTVTLYENKCINNHTAAFNHQQLNFISKNMIISKSEIINVGFNKMVCVLKNAYQWSSFCAFEETEKGIIAKEKYEQKSFNWFGAKITFSSYINDPLLIPPQEEETRIIQRLVVTIDVKERKNLKEFISIRNKILSLISFAIKNNVNIEEQFLYDFDDYYYYADNCKDYYKHYLYISEPTYDIIKLFSWEYNFKLNDLLEERDINTELEKLEPILGLYMSLFRYKDMPAEMVFLNIVQALETFHSRFFYNDKKAEYVKSVKERFGNSEMFNKLLLSNTQMDDNCNYIILVSRLNDLLIRSGCFIEYYIDNDNYAQIIADTRHYYTHYGKSKEAKALKDDDLLEAIYILRLLLEYHICYLLGIERRNDIVDELARHKQWKLLNEMHSNNFKV